jgi:hypothetical protein
MREKKKGKQMGSDEDSKLKEFLEAAEADMFPKLQSSAMSITILGKPDPKLCLELGAAILFDKPLIIFAPPGTTVPANLRRCASAIIEGDMKDEAVRQKLMTTLNDVVKNDARTRQ